MGWCFGFGGFRVGGYSEYMKKQTIRDIDLSGKLVLVRVDYNVPINDGQVGDTLRIKASADTINYLLERDCRIVLMSHLGEPKGAPEAKYSLKPVAAKAAEVLGHDITFYNDCVGPEVEAAVQALQPGEIMMLENVRFHQEELDDSPEFSERLAKYGEVYVNDAFAVDHRAQSSVSGVAAFLPAVAGLLVEREVDYILGALETPNRPLVAIIGGAKVSSKIEVLTNLIPKVDVLMLAGAMANTFFLAQGQEIGKSQAEPDFIDTANEMLALAKRENALLILPETVVVSKSLTEPQDIRSIPLSQVKPDDYIVDVAPAFADKLGEAINEFLDFDGKSTIIWNGPLGITEIPEMAHGSRALADAIVACEGISIIGGGDTAAFVDDAGLHDKFTWVSTGGGASLELMSGKPMPGIDALLDK